MSEKRIIVGMADLNVCIEPDYLTTLGLGSCVGIALYDSTAKIAGLAHSMLPYQAEISVEGARSKFVDTSVEDLIQQMVLRGAKKERLSAKIAGGAHMFTFDNTTPAMMIGNRNVEAAIMELRKRHIPLLAMDVGETYGRTVELYAKNGAFVIKSIGHDIKTL